MSETGELRMDRSSVQAPDQHHHGHGKRRPGTSMIRHKGDEQRSPGWLWAMVILCTLLAIGVIVAGASVFAVYLIYKPKMPYLVVTDAQIGRLVYTQDGTIQNMQVSINILAKNTNSKADASFSSLDIAVGFHGANLLVLRAGAFAVARQSAVPLPYYGVLARAGLDAAGMRAMEESLRSGVVPLDLFGKARTRWKMGIFIKVQFWTRIACRLHFNYPGNGTARAVDTQRCRSKSP